MSQARSGVGKLGARVVSLAMAAALLASVTPASVAAAPAKPAVTQAVAVAPPKAATVKKFANCTALNKAYRHGVGKKGARDKVSGRTKPVTKFTVDTRLYNAQSKSLDRDKDGIACEKH